MKTTTKIATAIAVALAATTEAAPLPETGPYFGIGLGGTSFSQNVAGYDLSGPTMAYNGYGGYQFNRYVARAGSVVTATTTVDGVVNVGLTGRAVGTSVLVGFPFAPAMGVYACGGAAYWTDNVTATVVNTGTIYDGVSLSSTKSGTNSIYGGGFYVCSGVCARTEFVHSDIQGISINNYTSQSTGSFKGVRT